MDKRNSLATFDFFQVFWDVAMITMAYLVAVIIYGLTMHAISITSYLWMMFIFTVIFVLTMFLVRMYNVTTFCYIDRIILRVVGSSVAAAVSISLLIFMLRKTDTSRLFYLVFCLGCCVLVTCQRLFLKKLVQRRNRRFATRVLFVGPEDVYRQYKHYVGQTSLSCFFVAQLPFDCIDVASPERLERFVIAHKIDEVAFTYGNTGNFEHEDYMRTCEEMGITVRLVMDMIELPVSKKFVNSIGTYPVITYHSVSMDKIQLFVKSIFDVVAAFVGLIITSPIFVITALAIRLESPGPIFFRQKRAGVNGKEFEIIKFRSMYIDAEERKKELMAQNKIKDGLMFKMDNDPRVTKVGRFIRKASIDELPQLFNVLKREMSLVGTRPPTLDEVGRYKRYHRRRISIRPGITGMWQVNGRSNVIDFESVVRMDSEYIDRWSLGLDFKLLFRTIVVVFTQKGAC